MTRQQHTIFSALCALDGEEVTNIFVNVFGKQILNDDLYSELEDMGLL
jgi:hypothetical protein